MESFRRAIGMAERIFGTDGVRGVANTQLDSKLAFDLGRAAVKFLGKRLVMGRDTRRSGDMLGAALAAGIMSRGGDVYDAGVIPTPAVALITSRGGYDGAVMISASHNPPKYNGIKFFSAEGFKLPDALEDEMQAYIEAGCPTEDGSEPYGGSLGKLTVLADAREMYIANAVDSLGSQDVSLEGLKIVVDCAHGASCKTTPEALERLGADVIAINTGYDGDDINVGCGSTDLGQVRQAVLDNGADVGLAHDGDADRLQAVDELGNPIDGDQIEAICAIDLRDRGLLAGNAVVSTVMCNLGLKKTMEREGIAIECTKVGDRYVLERMREKGYVLGGEQSGHMIFLQHNTTGDGLITALNLLSVLKRSGKRMSELAQVMPKYPQALVNVEVGDKSIFETDDRVADLIDREKQALGDEGNVLVRASGTEQLIRVMVEAADDETAQSVASRIADAIAEADTGR